ncbi:MAG: ABC transporter substrate-binding protein [Actinomycetota bacterium]|nr:ABC transporter substrate-binding protein [Actinomycetota bacterium]
MRDERDDELILYEHRVLLTRRKLLEGAAGAAAAFGLLGLAGCGGGGGGGEEEQAGGGAPKRGGILQAAISDTGGPKENLDPLRQTNVNDGLYTDLLYDALTDQDDNWNVHPVLAESWESNGKVTEWTFKLRRGVRWHDGKPFTSKDAAYSIGRLVDPKVKSPLYDRLSGSLAKSGISTPDDNTLVLKLKRPDSLIPLTLSARHARIVQAGTTDFSKGIGTGAFKLKSFKPARSWEVRRNDAWWNDNLPYLDGVRGVIIGEQSTKVQSVLSGDSHISDPIDFSAAASVKGNANAQLLEYKNATYLLVAMDSRKPPFDDERVRTAIKIAVNRNRLVQTAYQGYGNVTSDVPVPADDPFFPDQIGIRKQDVARAKQLLAAAGHPNGIDLELFTSQAYGAMVDLAVSFAQIVEPAGIRVKIKQWPADTYWDQVWLVKPMYTSYYTRRHPNESLSITYTSNAPWNESKLKSKKLDDLVAQGLAAKDKDEQQRIYQDALVIVANDAGTSIPAFINRLHVAKKNVKGLGLGLQTAMLVKKAYLA